MSGDDATRTGDSLADDRPNRNPRYDDWPLTDDAYAGSNYVGTTMDGTPVYHHEDRLFHGEPDPENERDAR